jgi:IS6 family transposase
VESSQELSCARCLQQDPFNWRHVETELMLLCVPWYLRSALSYREVEDILAERGLSVDHTTISLWGQRN